MAEAPIRAVLQTTGTTGGQRLLMGGRPATVGPRATRHPITAVAPMGVLRPPTVEEATVGAEPHPTGEEDTAEVGERPPIVAAEAGASEADTRRPQAIAQHQRTVVAGPTRDGTKRLISLTARHAVLYLLGTASSFLS